MIGIGSRVGPGSGGNGRALSAGSHVDAARRVPHTRTVAWLALIALTTVLPLACGDESITAPEPLKRNVVLIVVDTLRADHVGSYGYDLPTTPTLDALAARGVRVADVTAQSSWTGPSMVSMFLARHVAADFVRMPPQTTLAEHLNAHGWRTVGFQENILLAPGTGYDRGFEFYAMEPGPLVIEPVLNEADERPLFAYFHFVGPHDPWEPMPDFDVFEPRALDPDQLAAYGAYLHDLDPERPLLDIELEVQLAAAEMARQIALYDGDILQTDAKVKWVLGALESAGRLDDALVIVAADHGEGLWQHRVAELAFEINDDRRDDLLTAFKRTHNTLLYEELTRVPLIFAGPGVPEGLVLEGLAENVDLVPTLLDLLALPPLPGTDPRKHAPGSLGRSLLPAMKAREAGRPSVGRQVVVSNTDQFTAVRTQDGAKLILPWDATGPDAAQAFQLAQDSTEQHPAALSGEVLAQLMQSLQNLRTQGLKPLSGEGEIDAATRQRLAELGYLGDLEVDQQAESDSSGR